MKNSSLKRWGFVPVVLGIGVFAGWWMNHERAGDSSAGLLNVEANGKQGPEMVSRELAGPVTGAGFDFSKVPAYSGSFEDLVNEAKAALIYRVANLRLSFLLATTGGDRLRDLAQGIRKSNPSTWQEDTAEDAVVRRWTEADAGKAFAFFSQFPNGRRREFQYMIIDALAWIDGEAALAFARRLTNASERSRAISAVANVLARENPEEAVRLAGEEGKKGDYWRYNGVFLSWAERDPEAAYAAALNLKKGSEQRYALQGVFAKWTESDPEAAHQAAMSLPKGNARKQALNDVMSNWARRDPQAAFAAVKSTEDADKGLFRTVMASWASMDPVGAAAAFGTLNTRQQQESSSYIAREWASNDPRAAADWAFSLPSGQLRSAAMGQVFSKWAEEDGPAAAAALSRVPTHQRAQALQSVMSSWVGQDREAAMAWAENLESPSERSRALVSCATGVDFSDKEAIDSILAKIPSGHYRTAALQQIVQNNQWGESEGLVTWLQELSPTDRDTALNGGSFYSLIDSDPKATAALLAESQAGLNREWMWTRVADQLAIDDPAAALEWVNGIEAPALKKKAEISAISAWAQDDRNGAFDYARGLSDPKQKVDAVNAIINNWAQEDVEGLMRWAETAEGTERELGLLRGSLTLAANDPATSAKVVAGLLGSSGGIEDQLEGAVSQVAASWSREDVDSARAWVDELPSGKYQDKAMETVASTWAQFDSLAASEWISEMPYGKGRDGAVGSLVNAIADKDPESAFVWAASVGDTGARGTLITNAVNNWVRIDPAAARVSVDAATLPDALRASLMKVIEDSE
jgi:hypothetical protein